MYHDLSPLELVAVNRDTGLELATQTSAS